MLSAWRGDKRVGLGEVLTVAQHLEDLACYPDRWVESDDPIVLEAIQRLPGAHRRPT